VAQPGQDGEHRVEISAFFTLTCSNKKKFHHSVKDKVLRPQEITLACWKKIQYVQLFLKIIFTPDNRP
jgi:hypothetical protein